MECTQWRIAKNKNIAERLWSIGCTMECTNWKIAIKKIAERLWSTGCTTECTNWRIAIKKMAERLWSTGCNIKCNIGSCRRQNIVVDLVVLDHRYIRPIDMRRLSRPPTPPLLPVISCTIDSALLYIIVIKNRNSI
jgi:hypothetical protein